MGKPKSMSVIKVIPLCHLIRPNAKSTLHYDFGRKSVSEVEISK